MAAKNPQKWVMVDNDQDLGATVEYVFKILLAAAKQGVPAAIEVARREAPRPRARPAPIATPEEALARFLDLIDKRAEREPHVAAYLLGGLYGPGVDERRRALADKAPDTVLAGLNGLVDPVSWEIRERLMAKAPGRVARSLGGAARLHPRGAELRAALAAIAPLDVLAALDTVDTDEAWALRERLEATDPDVVCGSVTRIATPRAWELRERWLAAKGGEKALGEYENARVVCKAVTGLDDERAWDLRKEARDAAPISAVLSVKYVASDRAWKWRTRYLERAPKAVMDTVARIDDERAWALREKVAATVKEAIDSINELGSEPAWRMRAAHADTWPSTVVKSLGGLAATPQGRALVERQLKKFPDNLSLLKHVSGIALGANVDPELVPE
jgi:dTMP kinase